MEGLIREKGSRWEIPTRLIPPVTCSSYDSHFAKEIVGVKQSFYQRTQCFVFAIRCTGGDIEDRKMPASATMIGALLGLGTQMYSNALRKLPYMRHPWEHVLGMGLGAVFANQLVKWDAKLQEDLDKMLDKAKAANERRYFDEDE
ncbi:hypothetical protein L1987_43619 [Smallanthus sonchifolius]|uniref:Uncharacterized protein n=1 Tax=Smallanthus sonchifolius TaxID=185202 RepID=A0ACB9GNG0_9ASTR|nr:hypothetical protein L1987_43619 [Smallanthus sonchifolius]